MKTYDNRDEQLKTPNKGTVLSNKETVLCLEGGTRKTEGVLSFCCCVPSLFRGLRGPRTPAAVALPLHPDPGNGKARIPEGADKREGDTEASVVPLVDKKDA